MVPRRSRLRRPLEPEELVHVLVVLFLPVLAAQVEPQLVDYLDAVVAEPVVTAVGIDLAVNAVVDVVRQGRGGELTGPVPSQAAGPLTAEPGARAVVVQGAGRLGD